MEGLNSILSDGQPEVVAEKPAQAEQLDTTTEQPTGETTAPPADAQEDEVEKHRKGLEAGIAAERQRRQAAEQRAQQLEQQLKQHAQPPAAPKPQGDALARPKRDQFPDQEAYEDALLEYGDKRREARETQARQEREESERAVRVQEALNGLVKKGQEAHADFDARINSGLGPYLTPALQHALLIAKQGHEIAYWLSGNPAEVARISQLSHGEMLDEFGDIRATLRAESQDDKPTIPQTLTTVRNAQGRFAPAYSGPTPLDDLLAKR